MTVPVSAGLLVDVAGYFDALTAYRAGDPSPIVATFCAGTLAAITNATQLLAELEAIRGTWAGTIRARADSTGWRVADLLLRQPVLDTPTIARELGVPPQNAVRALEPLLAAGVITEFTGRRRGRNRTDGAARTAFHENGPPGLSAGGPSLGRNARSDQVRGRSPKTKSHRCQFPRKIDFPEN